MREGRERGSEGNCGELWGREEKSRGGRVGEKKGVARKGTREKRKSERVEQG